MHPAKIRAKPAMNRISGLKKIGSNQRKPMPARQARRRNTVAVMQRV
jgi:hypothetical protein